MLTTAGRPTWSTFRAAPFLLQTGVLLTGLLLAGAWLAADAAMQRARAQSTSLSVAPLGEAPAAASDDPTAAPLHKLGVSAQDHRVRLEHAGWPWTSLGRVNRAIGGYCTGALVAPHWVLTAAHCLYNFHDRRFAIPSDIHF